MWMCRDRFSELFVVVEGIVVWGLEVYGRDREVGWLVRGEERKGELMG
jgi:hypothetical protein